MRQPPFEVIYSDGFTSRHVGRGIVLRKNPEHIARCIAAIHNRWDNEATITIKEQDHEVQDLSGSGRVVSLEARSKQRKNRG